MLIDTHCHIHDRSVYNYALTRQQAGKKLRRTLEDDPAYGHYPLESSDFVPEKMIARAHAAGVEKMICIGTTHEDSLAARDFAEAHANDDVYWAYGIHPDEADNDNGEETRLFLGHRSLGPSLRASSLSFAPVGAKDPQKQPLSPRLVAIGEVGLDYSKSATNRKNQIKLFEQMLQLARDNDLPLIFHIREAFDDFFAVINNFPSVRGVVHSFSDNSANLQKSLDCGFYIGVNGLATFAPELPTREIPLDRILLETDAPFLTPTPFRGIVNEPAHIKDICAFVSKIKGESEARVAEITTKNAEQLFKI